MKRFRIALLFLVTVLFTTSCQMASKDNYDEVPFEIDDEIKTCLKLTNDFRTSSDAWYWNENNTTKTNLVGKLGKLTLDEDLCKAAKIRSKEIVKKFSHTRPDGSKCFTVFDDLGIKASSKGENIAAGNSSGSKTFAQWEEKDKKYDEQGHRRNMLGDFSKIGLAYTYSPNSEYKYYWVMILAK